LLDGGRTLVGTGSVAPASSVTTTGLSLPVAEHATTRASVNEAKNEPKAKRVREDMAREIVDRAGSHNLLARNSRRACSEPTSPRSRVEANEPHCAADALAEVRIALSSTHKKQTAPRTNARGRCLPIFNLKE
jgi:hypothetical protein